MELWEVAKQGVGKPPKFNSPEEMLGRAYEYFNWCKENTINAIKLFSSQGEVISGVEPKARAMTLDGLWIFLNISKSTWYNYKEKSEYLEVVNIIDSVIREQKFTGAAAGIFNPNIIARDLGLKDEIKTDHTSSDGSMRTYSPSDYKKAQDEMASGHLEDLD